MAEYSTLAGRSEAVLYEKKSQFIAYADHVKTTGQADEFLSSIKKKHYDASHWCYAFILRDGDIKRRSDDGEPRKTAGMPILDVIVHSGLSDVMIIVVRYFGGTLLGTGGLVRAYGTAARNALRKGEILVYRLCADLVIEIDYTFYDRLISALNSEGAKILSADFTDRITLKIRTLAENFPSIEEIIKTVTRGVQPEVLGESYEIF